MLGWRHYHFRKIDSTSAFLKRRRFVLPSFCFVRSDYQTNGRGRTDRTWESERGKNLLFSLIVKEKKTKEIFPCLSVCSAVAVVKALKKLGLKGVSIKWPNDVYVNGKKICGILLDGFLGNNDESDDCVIIGIGLNVNQKTFGDGLLCSPTSISLERGKKMPIRKVKNVVYKTLEKEIKKVYDGNFDCIEFFRQNDYLKGKTCYAILNGKKTSIDIIGIDDDCSLKIKSDGVIKNIGSGEISFHL